MYIYIYIGKCVYLYIRPSDIYDIYIYLDIIYLLCIYVCIHIHKYKHERRPHRSADPVPPEITDPVAPETTWDDFD